MMENKTIGYSALALIAVSLSIFGGISLLDDDVYYCQANSKVMQCDRLSQYYSLDNGKCWNEEIGNKLCRSGWLKVQDNTDLKSLSSINQGENEDCDRYECS